MAQTELRIGCAVHNYVVLQVLPGPLSFRSCGNNQHINSTQNEKLNLQRRGNEREALASASPLSLEAPFFMLSYVGMEPSFLVPFLLLTIFICFPPTSSLLFSIISSFLSLCLLLFVKISPSCFVLLCVHVSSANIHFVNNIFIIK